MVTGTNSTCYVKYLQTSINVVLLPSLAFMNLFCLTIQSTVHCLRESRVSSIRDLGISLECNMSFSSHIHLIINRAFKMLGFIYRNTRHFKYKNTINVLYFSLIRSHLEFELPNYFLSGRN